MAICRGCKVKIQEGDTYCDRCFHTPPRLRNREAAITELVTRVEEWKEEQDMNTIDAEKALLAFDTSRIKKGE